LIIIVLLMTRHPLKTKTGLFIAAIAMLLSAASARANVVLPDIISRGMVLQRDHAVPIWGKADTSRKWENDYHFE
jgi:hypothetical protein